MYRQSLQIAILCTLSIAIGCGGGSSSSSSPEGTPVTVTFTGTAPQAVAVQTGTGSFATIAVNSSSVSISIPSGTSNFAIGYACPPAPGFGNTVTSEYIFEATVSDGAAFSQSCGLAPATGSATGAADVTAIAGATNVEILGKDGYSASLGATSGSFNATLPTGTNDIAVVALNSSNTILAVKFVRNQTVPGAINGGATITLGASDLVTTQTFATTNFPSGFVTPPAVDIDYYTANGTYIELDITSATQYPAVPAAAVEAGDFYSYESNTTDTATQSSVSMTQNTTSGGAATIAFPTPWSYAGPTEGTFPTFTFDYSGFSSLAATTQQAMMAWAPTPTTATQITVTATAAYQAGSTTIAIPDLSSLVGFSTFAAPPSGTTTYWGALIYGGTVPEYQFYSNPPSNGTQAFVQNEGSYSQP